MSFKKEAREQLAEDLQFGKKVNGLTLRDLILCDLSGERCGGAALDVAAILVADEPDRSLYCSRYLDRLISEYLDKKEDEINELAAVMAADYMESQRTTA